MQDALAEEFDEQSHNHLVLTNHMAQWEAGRQAGMETQNQAGTDASNQKHTQTRSHS